MQFYFILISGRNPDYLIGHQVDAAPILKNKFRSNFNGIHAYRKWRLTAVEAVSKTKPLSKDILSML
jgi:putative glycerol-1-phosphate prenyltransferase